MAKLFKKVEGMKVNNFSFESNFEEKLHKITKNLS
jgi:hypothetical protein